MDELKVYEVRNKVFSQLFKDIESAELFMSQYNTTPTCGLEIIERQVLKLIQADS